VRIAERNGSFEIESVEHLFAALGAWSARRGLDIAVEGDEIPLADGGATRFAEALAELRPPSDPPFLLVAKAGRVDIGGSTYEFEPGPDRCVEVEVDFGHAGIGKERARWDGSFSAFLSEVAWARTFGFRRDAEHLFAGGRARGVDPRVVMVLDDRGRVEPPGAPARHAEFARHKLLDLIGDLFVFGGPPRGAIFARRPGHGATHRAVAIASEKGLLVRGDSARGAGAW
jgi:UDP-3-O-[3-hydroxymyristoyl] N-acetylglucosamine deacetylase